MFPEQFKKEQAALHEPAPHADRDRSPVAAGPSASGPPQRRPHAQSLGPGSSRSPSVKGRYGFNRFRCDRGTGRAPGAILSPPAHFVCDCGLFRDRGREPLQINPGISAAHQVAGRCLSAPGCGRRSWFERAETARRYLTGQVHVPWAVQKGTGRCPPPTPKTHIQMTDIRCQTSDKTSC